MSDFERIARAIAFVTRQSDGPLSPTAIADHLQMSPVAFRRLFARWAGVEPRTVLQVLTPPRVRELLRESRLLPAARVAREGPVRLYVEPPADVAARDGLTIEYGMHDSPFGSVLVAFADRGICHLAFLHEPDARPQLERLAQRWPGAGLRENRPRAAAAVEDIFDPGGRAGRPLSVHVTGTAFQASVWRTLLRIPPGGVASYRQVAEAVGRPAAARAVGMANGANPVPFLVPCHRVVRQGGDAGGFACGLTLKHAMHAWEAARYG